MAPAAATRSKKAAKRVTPASKVTKKTSNAANKAPKAKKATKAKTPPPREEILVHKTSPSTISPDEIDETPPPAVKVDLQELIAQLSKVQEERNHRHRHDGRVHKSRRHHHRHRHSRSHRHRHSDTSDSDSSDSESDWEERRGVPFRHSEGKKPFLSIAERFRGVDVKYFKQIFFGTFKTKNFAKLAPMHTTPAEEDKDVNGHNHMMHCFHVYSVAAGRFAHVSVKEDLNEALHLYAIRLLRLPITYRFDSILAYHLAFVTARIQGGQDDPKAWEADDQSCRDLLVPKCARIRGSRASIAVGPPAPVALGHFFHPPYADFFHDRAQLAGWMSIRWRERAGALLVIRHVRIDRYPGLLDFAKG